MKFFSLFWPKTSNDWRLSTQAALGCQPKLEKPCQASAPIPLRSSWLFPHPHAWGQAENNATSTVRPPVSRGSLQWSWLEAPQPLQVQPQSEILIGKLKKLWPWWKAIPAMKHVSSGISLRCAASKSSMVFLGRQIHVRMHGSLVLSIWAACADLQKGSKSYSDIMIPNTSTW